MTAEIQPQLWVQDTADAVRFYRRAFRAVVEHRVGGEDDPDGVIQLSVGAAKFWLAGVWEEMGRLSPSSIGGATGRMLLVVSDPRDVVDSATAAGARLLSPVAEEHGWLVGRVVDPFGHEWEIGRPGTLAP